MSLTNINLSAGPGIAAVGSILSVATPGSPVTYRPVGNVGNQKWNMKRKTADVSNQGTAWTQTIGTLGDGGTFTADVHFIPGSVAADSSGAFGHGFISGLGYLYTNNITAYWSLTAPNGQIAYFVGFISDFPLDLNVEKDMMVNITITVSGEPIFVSM